MGKDVDGGLQPVGSKKILVVHPCYNTIGGADEVLLKILEVLVERGYDVSLLGKLRLGSIFDGLPLSDIKQIPYGSEAAPKSKRFQAYRTIINRSKLTRKARKVVGHFDLEINTQELRYFIGASNKCVAYVHFPELVDRMQKSGLKHRLFWRLYYWPIVFQLKRKVRSTGLLLCNSCYTRGAIMGYWGRVAEVVYPPVDVEDFKPVVKEFFVVSVGRFAPEKNFELVVEVARRMPDVKFVIAGRRNSNNPSYFDRIVALRPGNVDLVVDVSRGELSVLLGRAKVYLHGMVGEHFGISVGEAMAAGCVPVVHSSGGPKEIVGSYGFLYSSVEECVKAVESALRCEVDPVVFVERAKMFSSDSFKKNFIDVLEKKGFL